MRQLNIGADVARSAVITALISLSGASVSLAQAPAAPQCQPSGPLVRISELSEGSGVAVSRRTPGRLWAHNDSGQPVLIALDAQGALTGRVRVSGTKVEDWEAVAVGACPGGSCVYIADIGDNDGKRTHITIHRIPEPAAEDTVTVKDTFHATYPDGAHDAEAFLVAPDGAMFIVTKGETSAVGLYRFPRELQSGATHPLARVGKPRGSGKSPDTEQITDGVVSPDGAWVVLRTKRSLSFYRAAEFLAGNWPEAGRVDLKDVGEPQGEGVALSADGTLFLAGEGGGKGQPGTLARISCSVK